MLADRLLDLILSTSLDHVRLPRGVRVLDPLRGENSAEVRRIVRDFHRRFFNDERPHQALGYQTPSSFYDSLRRRTA